MNKLNYNKAITFNDLGLLLQSHASQEKVATQWFHFHTPLIGAYAVVSFFANNINLLELSRIFKPLIVTELFVLACMLVSYAFFKNVVQSNFLASGFCFIFFLYGHVHNLVDVPFRSITGWGAGRVMFVLWIGFFALLILFVIKKKSKIEFLSRPLFFLAFICLSIPTLRILNFEWQNRSISQLNNSDRLLSLSSDSNKMNAQDAWVSRFLSENRLFKDIYFILPDRYPSNEVLKTYFKFNNKKFNDFLQKKGFVIQNNIRASYLGTTHSLASTLNMQRHERLIKNNQGIVPTNKIFTDMIRNNRVAKILKKLGYNYYLLGSWWKGTQRSELASINYFEKYRFASFLPMSFLFDEFSTKFIRTTWAYPLLKYFLPLSDSESHRNISIEQFRLFPDVMQQKGPRFCMIHLLLPHAPYVFNKDGTLPKNRNDEDTLFLNQLIYTNSKLKEIINSILKESKTPPIILLMSDEGQNPTKPTDISEKDFHRSRLGTTFAIYAPHIQLNELDSNFASVNTFRYLLNMEFGSRYTMLPNRNFALSQGRPAKEITDYWLD